MKYAVDLSRYSSDLYFSHSSVSNYLQYLVCLVGFVLVFWEMMLWRELIDFNCDFTQLRLGSAFPVWYGDVRFRLLVLRVWEWGTQMLL